MKIQRDLKFGTFVYDDEDKSITIETRSDAIPPRYAEEPDEEYAERIANTEPPTNGRIHLNKVYSFALLRFVIRIAQRNWFRKIK